ncbi:hypothetical protein M2271_001040 [Streptomyces sp. LBL]|nr:hypothetical protein [Streptomyces sp. LBL]
MGDDDAERAGNPAADVEEAEAALELLVQVGGGLLDGSVQQNHRLGVGFRRDDHGGAAVDADWGSGDAHALAERVQLPYSADGVEEFTDEAAGMVGFGRQVDAANGAGENGGAFVNLTRP